MKITELTQQILDTLREHKIEISIKDESYFYLRIMGLLYNKFVYTKALRTIKPTYTPEQVVEATKLAISFAKKIDFKNLEEKHYINILIKAIDKQLQWNFLNKEDLNEMLEMEI